jgi:hypothetical protein
VQTFLDSGDIHEILVAGCLLRMALNSLAIGIQGAPLLHADGKNKVPTHA